MMTWENVTQTIHRGVRKVSEDEPFVPMTPNELWAILGLFDMNIERGAKFLGVSRRTLSRYKAGPGKPSGTEVPKAYAMLLRTLVAEGISPEQAQRSKPYVF